VSARDTRAAAQSADFCQHGQPAPLLPAIDKHHVGRKCLVLDLDETLLHSSFKVRPDTCIVGV
jgi:TFIIF-interacting CTD phosphatase-like protein